MNHQDIPVILHNEKRGLLTVEDGRLDVLQLSRDGRPPKRLVSGPLRNFLLAKLAAPPSDGKLGEPRRLDLHTLNAKGSHLRLVKMHVLVEPINVPEAEEWVTNIMREAYGDIKPFRKVLLLVNPVGGKGKGKRIVRDDVLPILQAAGCQVKVMETTHRSHAEEIARDLKLEYDVISTASGDGLVYEVINGLAARPDARRALRTPIAPIPTGSANSVCVNLFGVKDTFNIQLACLNIIKGRHMSIDLCSVLLLPSMTRRFAFLSAALGLMVDLDIGTENLRWLGDTRFVVGFLKGVASNKNFKCRLRMKVVEDDKVEMAKKARDRVRERRGHLLIGGGEDPLTSGMKKMNLNSLIVKDNGQPSSPATNGQASTDGDGAAEQARDGDYDDNGPLPEARPLEADDTWLTIETGTPKPEVRLRKPSKSSLGGDGVTSVRKNDWIDGEGLLYFYAGMMPWAARDLMQWPVATSCDGLIDVVVQSVVNRSMMVNAITGAEKGEAYWLDCQHYYKVSSIIADNMDRENQPIFTIDGEAFPFDTFHLQVYPKLATLLSLDGDYYISDFIQKHETK